MQKYIEYYIEANKSRIDTTLNIDDTIVYVQKNVFTPNTNITASSQMVLNKLKTIDLIDKTVLDVGCGSGILSLYCLQHSAKYVYATDIDDNAIDNATINLSKYKNCLIIKSDLFKELNNGQIFDILLFNLPICNEIWDVDILELYDSFFKQIKYYLQKDGIAIGVFAQFGEIDKFRSLFAKHEINYLEEKHLFFGFYWSLFTINNKIENI